MRHLIDIPEFSVEELDELMDTASDIIANPTAYADACRGKKLATLFFEPSTRTRLSFEAAMLELGGSVIGFSEANSSSAAKGESIADTAKTDDDTRRSKLEKELTFMKEKGAAFVFTGYEFADEYGKGLGKIVKVPPLMNYRDALKNTTIFTTTVIFDTDKVDKSLLEMPIIKSEDTALWWKVLRNGYQAYGLDENLALYRRAGRSLSSNKLEAIRRIWNLYRRAEGLSVLKSSYYFCFWAIRAVKRRV